MTKKAQLPFIRICSGRFSLLLVTIILTFALRPFLEGFIRINILTDIFLSVIFLSAIRAVSDKRSAFLIAIALVFPYLLFRWSTYLVNTPLAWRLADVFAALLTAHVLICILSYIARQKEVTSDLIMAAVCGYFLLGFMWGFIYLFLESVQPGSYQIAQIGKSDQSHFIYFSFVTMTTVGYGDILPISNAARSLAVLEAAIGQLYLAITIARLVGAHTTQKQEKQAE